MTGDIIAAEPAEPFDAAEPPKRRRVGRIVAVVVVLALVAGGVGYASTTDAWPGRKKTWDPSILPLARFVENTRGGRFEEPVEVVFNSDADYSDHFAIDRDEVDEDEQEELEHDLGVLRALGVVAGDLDLLDTAETIGESGTLGFFDPDDGKIHVRGDRSALDASLRVTLVHELTHAYDFAHFELDVDEDRFANSGEEFAYRAVVEGSAKLVEWEYLESLPQSEQDEVMAEAEEQAEGADAEALEAVPDLFLELIGLPYTLGPRFLLALGAVESGSPSVVSSSEARKGVDRALKTWPKSEEQVADIDEYLEGGAPRKVSTPKLADGEKESDDPDDFGQLSLALLLAPHVGSEAAWRAVQGWAGDASATYRVGDDGPPCIRIAVGFDGANFAGEFLSAARTWAAAIPGASARNDGEKVVLEACDPGPDGPPVVELEGVSVTEVVAARSDLESALTVQGVPEDAAACVTDKVLTRMGVSRFLELDAQLVEQPDDAAAQQEVAEVFTAAATQCGLGPPG